MATKRQKEKIKNKLYKAKVLKRLERLTARIRVLKRKEQTLYRKKRRKRGIN